MTGATDAPWSAEDARALHDLIAGSRRAALEVTYPGGDAVVAPLAPCIRIEPPGFLWLLPLPRGAAGLADFDLSSVRRRGFHVATVRCGRPAVTLTLVNGATAIIRPAHPSETQVIDMWMDFVSITLSTEQRAAVESLQFDTL